VPVGPANDVPPAEQMVEARIGVFPDVFVPSLPITITCIFDLVCSHCVSG